MIKLSTNMSMYCRGRSGIERHVSKVDEMATSGSGRASSCYYPNEVIEMLWINGRSPVETVRSLEETALVSVGVVYWVSPHAFLAIFNVLCGSVILRSSFLGMVILVFHLLLIFTKHHVNPFHQ